MLAALMNLKCPVKTQVTMSFSRRGGYSRSVDPQYRSGSEGRVVAQLEGAGVNVSYETHHIKYIIPESSHTYTPDIILPNGIIVEVKGLFSVDDRKKHLLVKQQYPHLDIRFVFDNPKAKINSGSKTTYADWCLKNGYKCSKKLIPPEWLKEPKRGTAGLVKKEKKKK